ncbi:hypothetical protein ACLMJK_000169 [Lecanora helva]
MGAQDAEATALVRPMNVEKIVERAQNFEFNPLIPLKHWLRSASTLLKEAKIYEHEGNDAQTYLLLFRHAQLVLGNLTNHPEGKATENRQGLAQAEKDVNKNLKKLEVLKPRINAKYQRYEQLLRDRDARRASAAKEEGRKSTEKKLTTQKIGHRRLLSDPAVATGTEALTAEDNRDLAVNLAHEEIRRRATARKATRQAGISEEEEQERRTAGVWGNWEEAFAQNDTGSDQDTLSKQMQNVHLRVNGSMSNNVQNGRNLGSHRPSDSQRSSYHYPTVPMHANNDAWKTSSNSCKFLDDYSTPSTPRSPMPPELPPKDDPQPSTYQTTLPPRPNKEALPSYKTAPPAPPYQDPKKSAYVFQPSAYLENGTPLRSIFLPQDLRHRFLSIAQVNTRANLETCGILCGTLVSNALFISRLVIPDQESTSDTCETVNESELFDYVDGEDLMVLGWIHTHPTQTCFMSSRDLHTHGGYQVMMPESIAIVCAPSKGEWGVFRLTDPPGMKTVLNCTQTGLFHPHAESNIYTEALRPGHVVEVDGLDFELVDLRPG